MKIVVHNFFDTTFQSFYMDFSKLFHGFVKIDTWISLHCYMDILLFTKQTKLKFDQDFIAL